MSDNCDGLNVVDEVTPKTLGEAFQQDITVEQPKLKFPPDRVFSSYVKIPYVAIEYLDISPYLNRSVSRSESPLDEPNKEFKKFQNDIHKERLSQKCIVRLTRDNLTGLRASLRRNRKLSRSNSERSSCTDNEMASRCKICDKCYESEKKLLNHQRKKHIICINSKPMKHVSFSDHVVIHEVREYHKCRKCPKIFESYRSLKLHTKREHKKRKCYICNYCNRNFAERLIFKVHIKLHCDSCGLLLPNKAKYIQHRQTVCRVIKLHPCPECGLSFYSRMYLKDHSYDHGDGYLICDICRDQFTQKCAIAHHIAFLHKKICTKTLYSTLKVGNERLYVCNFCNESSVEQMAIEQHISILPDLQNRAMTGYKDYYFCEVCMQKFPTEQVMLHHKWTHFLKTNNNEMTDQSILRKLLIQDVDKVKTKTYNVNEKLPLHFQPKVVLQRLDLEGSVEPPEYIDIEIDMNPHALRKAIVDPKSRKTLLSRHQCETCAKYFSNNYCLKRHIATMHSEDLRCRVCEEIFVWPSLLRTHKCIRLHHDEMPFDDSRPEIHFDNLHSSVYFDDFNIAENDDYMNAIDFEIPAPVVELTEGDTILPIMHENQPRLNILQEKYNQIQSLGYKLVMQEVPIEF